MNTIEINEALANLKLTSIELENEYIQNEGECTESTDNKETMIASIKELLNTEGIDSLGRWMKAKEDEVKAFKAEKDYISRRIASVNNTIDYIKTLINQVMVATGEDKLKGSCGYSFATMTSEKTEVDKEILNALYKDKIEEILTANHIPCWVNVTLTASSTKFNQFKDEFGVSEFIDADEQMFNTTIKETIRFTKPRASKEE